MPERASMTYAVSYRLGEEAILYYGAAGSTAATAFGLVKTVSHGIERSAVEGNYRDSKFTNTRSGQAKYHVTITGRRKPSDTTYAAFKDAAIATDGTGNVVALKIIPVSGATEDTIDADFTILKFDTPENLGEFQEFTVEAALNIDQRAPTFA